MDVKYPVGLADSQSSKLGHALLVEDADIGTPTENEFHLHGMSFGINVENPQSDEASICRQLKEKDQQQPGLPSLRNSILRSDGVICHTLKSCNADIDKVEIQMSESCQKRFVMFDHSGSKKRIIMHPAMLDEFPTLLSLSSGDHVDYLGDISVRAVTQMKETLVRSPLVQSTTCDPQFVTNWRPSLSSGRGCLDSGAFSLVQIGNSNLKAVTNSAAQTRSPNLESSQDYHEDTEELDAFMSSDDETSSTGELSSTGHSPNDFSNRATPDLCNYVEQSISADFKRKRALEGYSFDDTDDTATSGDVFSNGTYCSYPTGWGRASGYGKGGFTVFDLSCSDEVSSSSSSNNQKLYKKPLSQDQSPMTKKLKIKDTFRLLHEIIPGSESMDNALVLEQAIQYVKTLQDDVQKLEVKNSD